MLNIDDDLLVSIIGTMHFLIHYLTFELEENDNEEEAEEDPEDVCQLASCKVVWQQAWLHTYHKHFYH